MDPDPDPTIFVIDLQDSKSTFTSFSKDEKSKSQNSRNQGFSSGLMIEGSGSLPLISGSRSESRRPKTYGSGFGYGSATLVQLMWIFVSTEFYFIFGHQKSWLGPLRVRIHQSLEPDSMNMDPQHRLRPSNLPLVSNRRLDQIWLGAFGSCALYRVVPRRIRIVVYFCIAKPKIQLKQKTGRSVE